MSSLDASRSQSRVSSQCLSLHKAAFHQQQLEIQHNDSTCTCPCMRRSMITPMHLAQVLYLVKSIGSVVRRQTVRMSVSCVWLWSDAVAAVSLRSVAAVAAAAVVLWVALAVCLLAAKPPLPSNCCKGTWQRFVRTTSALALRLPMRRSTVSSSCSLVTRST